ncbi:MAG: zinc ABC transporter substrate-binding protein [Nitrospinae bacterium]|nr:zinc ABC transporter substrate-binding protein [Nitrospinota bacterium]
MNFRKGALAMAFLLILAAACQRSAPQSTGRPRVIVTLFPLYDFTRAVGGGRADVTMLLSPGMEPHAYEPPPSDVAGIMAASLFIYTGAAMEPWAERILKSAPNPRRLVADTSNGIRLMEGEKDDGHHHERGGDPHIWLDFENAQKMVNSIAEAFAKIDRNNAQLYRDNASVYNKQLEELDAAYQKGLARCATRELIHGGHYAFGYMARRYRLDYHAAYGFSPEAEPSANTMMALTKLVKSSNARGVFYEELVLPKTAQAIAGEAGVPLLQLNAAHNITREQMARGVTFIGLMRENLQNLRTGLACE